LWQHYLNLASLAQFWIKKTTPELLTPRWVYLANLIYRAWFQLSGIMRKNSTDQLKDFTTFCEASSMAWPTVSCAAESMGAFSPTPQIFQDQCGWDISRRIRHHGKAYLVQVREPDDVMFILFGYNVSATLRK
jgi:hypothetical protein